MNKDVFIGSSKESKNTALILGKELESQNINPRPWWEEFPAGSFTLPRLFELSRLVDGAVFIFGEDDETWYRGDKVSKARDNVVLEWGIFASQLGPGRCLILRKKGVKLPNDLDGLVYECDATSKKSAEKMVKRLKDVFNKETNTEAGALIIMPDNRLGMIQISEELPKDWMLRGFYLGLDGAKAWLAVSTDPVYKDNAGLEDLRAGVLSRIGQIRSFFRTFVSLGPGDGFLDENIVLRLKQDEPALLYIPVDISDGLLVRVCVALGSKVSIPVGLLADFEGHLDFVATNVKLYAKSPILYGLLGGTFGNLDTNEYRFLSGLIGAMSPGDVFLFDVALNRTDSTAAPKAPPVHGMSEGRKKFYSHGAARVLGIKQEDVFAKFDDYISTDLCDSPSDVPGTKVVVFFVNDGAIQRPFAYMRRYTLPRLIDWLKEHFEIQVECDVFPARGLYGRALLTVRKKR